MRSLSILTEIILETRRKCNRSGLERQPSLLLLFF